MGKIMNQSIAKKNVYYDKESDVLYFGVKRGAEEEFAEVAPGVSVEMDKDGRAIGVEVLNASQVLKPIAKSLRLAA